MTLDLPDGRRVEFVVGDITRDPADAIVNAANSSLLGGGGVDGAIHRAGGRAILDQCRAIVARRGELEPGGAVLTSGGLLRARHVIHTVGPLWAGGADDESATLARCYLASIALADEHGLACVAFPSISTGVFGYPVDLAAPVALAAVVEGLRVARSVRVARFVLFDDRTSAAYRAAAGSHAGARS